MSAEHEKLAWRSAQTGYSEQLIAVIAHAAISDYRPGEPLDERQAGIVCDAVDFLAQAGYRPEILGEAIEHYRRTGGAEWRERFWSLVVRRANRRFSNAAYYGVSPVETDAVRLARWGPAPVWGNQQDTGEPLAA